MKIRNGFVSNSSSSSFVIISKEPLSVIKSANTNTSNWKYVHVTTSGASYGRGDIALCRTLEDKLRHFAALYAIYYGKDKYYSIKMDSFQSKIVALGKKYGYMISIECPPLLSYVCQADQSERDPKVVTYIDINNECNYLEEVVKIIENEDTTEFESYLFNPHSFCVIGGDEYSETFRLAHKMRKFVDKEGYEYKKFGDIMEDHEIGDPCSWNEEETYTWAYHWGDYTLKNRIVWWKSKLHNLWWKIKYHELFNRL